MKLYVGRLPYQTTDQDLADIFGQLGQVLSATVIIDRDSGRSKGFGLAVTRVEVAVQTAAAVEMGTGIGVTKYPGAVNYAW